MSIDLGINNLYTLGTNCKDVKENVIINGKTC